jgi:hypothetical protein
LSGVDVGIISTFEIFSSEEVSEIAEEVGEFTRIVKRFLKNTAFKRKQNANWFWV